MNSRSGSTWTLVATILASGIVFLDSSVVNVALPAIDRELEAGLSGLQWVVDGYILTLGAFLILGGSLGDRYGRRRAMMFGLAGFGATSIACGLAQSVPWLIAARMLQGMSGALLVPGSLAILRAVFAEGEQRGQAIGTWSGWAGITTVIGPLLGGYLVDNVTWRWVFFINLPIIIATVWLMNAYVPESRNREAAGSIDWAGALLAVIGLGGLATGLIQGPAAGWGDGLVLLALAAGVAAVVAFVQVERHRRDPMVPFELFQARNFSGANLATLGVYFALYGTTFFLVIYIQNVMGFSALQAGLSLAPISLLMLVLSPKIGELAGRYGPRLFMSVGPVVIAAGLLLFTRLGPDSTYLAGLLPGVTVMGLGLATTVAPLTDTVISAVPEGRAGVAAALNNVVSRVAGLLAVAGLGVVLAGVFSAALAQRTADLALAPSQSATLSEIAEDPTGAANAPGLPEEVEAAVDGAYTQAFRRVMAATAGVALIAGLVAAVTIRNEGAGTELGKRAR